MSAFNVGGVAVPQFGHSPSAVVLLQRHRTCLSRYQHQRSVNRPLCGKCSLLTVLLMCCCGGGWKRPQSGGNVRGRSNSSGRHVCFRCKSFLHYSIYITISILLRATSSAANLGRRHDSTERRENEEQPACAGVSPSPYRRKQKIRDGCS